jgi:hypothetical protein
MNEDKYYATVRWTVEDVLTLRTTWTEEQAEEWLSSNEKYIESRLIELGWDVMESLMPDENEV